MITMSLFGLMMCASMNTVEASCAKGKGTEIKGNSSGTYCMSRIGMNWRSAHAWCNAIEMKLITVDECDCTDEIKCDMTIACPNLHFPNISANAWTTMPFGSGSAHYVELPSGEVKTYSRGGTGATVAMSYLSKIRLFK